MHQTIGGVGVTIDLGHPILLLTRDIKCGVRHSEWLEDVLRTKLIKRLARDDLNNMANDVNTPAVVPVRAWLEAQRHAGQRLNKLGKRGRRRSRRAKLGGVLIELVDRVTGIPAIAQPGGMGKQVPHGHWPLQWLQQQVLSRSRSVDLDVTEARDKGADRRVQVKGPMLIQQHGRDTG